MMHLNSRPRSSSGRCARNPLDGQILFGLTGLWDQLPAGLWANWLAQLGIEMPFPPQDYLRAPAQKKRAALGRIVECEPRRHLSALAAAEGPFSGANPKHRSDAMNLRMHDPIVWVGFAHPDPNQGQASVRLLIPPAFGRRILHHLYVQDAAWGRWLTPDGVRQLRDALECNVDRGDRMNNPIIPGHVMNVIQTTLRESFWRR